MSLVPNFDDSANAIALLTKAYGSFVSDINQLIPETTTPIPTTALEFNPALDPYPANLVTPSSVPPGPNYNIFTVGRDGKYQITVNINWSPGPLLFAGQSGFNVFLLRNGANVPDSSRQVHNSATTTGVPCPNFTCQWDIPMLLGDTVQVMMSSGFGVGQGFTTQALPGGLEPAIPSATLNILQID